jgi:hypothetical protein
MGRVGLQTLKQTKNVIFPVRKLQLLRASRAMVRPREMLMSFVFCALIWNIHKAVALQSDSNTVQPSVLETQSGKFNAA